MYKEVVSIGAAAGADLVLIETMSDSYELKAAVLAAKEAGIDPKTGERLPIFATVIYDEKGKLLTGGNVESTVALLEGLGVDVLGINCGLGPEQMKDILADILKVSSTPVLVNPNAGLPRSENGKTVYDVDPEDFAAVMEEIVKMGAVVTGGCCGTTPDHIRAMVELTKDIPVQLPEKKHRTVISSYSQAVVFDKKTIIIGERINPTGKSKFKQALRDHDLEYILREGVTQQDNGADVLDVNVGLPEIDEPSMMEDVVKELHLSSILIADAGLGTINSVVLTVEYMKSHDLPLKGIIFNHCHPGNVMEEDNIFMCEHMTGLPTLARVCDGDTSLSIDAATLSELYDEVTL